MKKKTKIILSIVLIVVLGWLFLETFPGIWIVPYYRLYLPESKFPEIYAKPVERSIEDKLKPARGKVYTYTNKDLEISFPWGRPIEIKEGKLENGDWWMRLNYADSRRVSLTSSSVKPSETFTRDRAPEEIAVLEKAFGKSSLDSEYLFAKSAYSSSPENISLFQSRSKVIGQAVLIPIKRVMLAITPVYFFETDTVKGFQFGDPGGVVSVNLFEEENNLYNLVIGPVNQEELDYILSSVRFK